MTSENIVKIALHGAEKCQSLKLSRLTVNDVVARYLAFALPNFILVLGSKCDYKMNAIALKRILRIKKYICFMPMNTQQSSEHQSYLVSV